MSTKTNPDSEMTAIPKNLHKLVRFAVGSIMPTAVQKNSFIVNEIPREYQIATDENLLATIFTSLLGTVVSYSRHSCIRISAKEYDDMIFVCVRDNSSYSNYVENSHLEEVQLLAKKMNGSISIKNEEDKFTTILISFPNFPIAA